MKDKILYLALLFFMSLCDVCGQTKDVTLARDLSGRQYKGVEELFETGISNVGFSSDERYASIVTGNVGAGTFSSGKSQISLFDMKMNRVLWTHEVKGTAKTAIPTKYGVFANVGDKVEVLDFGSGIYRRELKIRPVYMDDSLDLILGYKGGSDHKLMCHRLSDGSERWQGKVDIDHSWGWDEVMELPGNRLLLVADDICLIDLLTGQITTHAAMTGYTKGSVKLAHFADSFVTGFLFGAMSYVLFPQGGFSIGYNVMRYDESVVNHLCSNILEQDSCYYISDRNSLRAFDKDLHQLWEYKYPSERASKSFLFGQHGTIYMLNMGFGVRGTGETVKDSRPFIASLNSHTGEPFFFKPLTVKNEMLNDAMITPWEAWYLQDDGLVFQRDINDSEINMSEWDTKKGLITEAVRDTIYVKNDSTRRLDPIWCDWKQLPVKLNNGNVVVVDQRLNEVAFYPREKVYYPLQEDECYLYVCRNRDKNSLEIWMLGRSDVDRQIRLTKGACQVWKYGNMVYYTTERSLCYFELTSKE